MKLNLWRDTPEDESLNDDFGEPKYCKMCGHEISYGTICESCENKTYMNDEDCDFCNINIE